MLTLKDVTNAWDKFFFSERPTYNLALFRIFWGSLIFLYVLTDIGNVADFYGPQAIVSLEVVKARFNYFHFSLFNLFDESLSTAYGIYFFTLISLLMVTIGLYTRAFLFAALIGIVSLNMRNVWLLNSGDVLIRCIFFILIWSPCFNVLSIDSYLARKKGSPLSVNSWQWTWRMIQIQIAVLYLWTFWSKLKGDNWFDGSAVYYATRLETMKNLTIPWILDSKIIIMISTWLTLMVECALGTLIWFRKLRTPVIVAGILLHLGIEVTMAIPFFEWFMIVLLMNFYTPEEHANFYQKFRLRLSLFIKELKFSGKLKTKILDLMCDDEERV